MACRLGRVSVVSSLTLGFVVRLGCPRSCCRRHKGGELKTHCTFLISHVCWGCFILKFWEPMPLCFLEFRDWNLWIFLHFLCGAVWWLFYNHCKIDHCIILTQKNFYSYTPVLPIIRFTVIITVKALMKLKLQRFISIHEMRICSAEDFEKYSVKLEAVVPIDSSDKYYRTLNLYAIFTFCRSFKLLKMCHFPFITAIHFTVQSIAVICEAILDCVSQYSPFLSVCTYQTIF